jgi:hypothetical protein
MLRIISTLFLAVLAYALRKVGTHELAPAEPPAPEQPDPDSRKAGHELSEAHAVTIAAVVIGLFLTIGIAMAVSAWMYVRLYTPLPAIPAPAAETGFPHATEARSSIADDWAAINRQANERLETYGWVSRADGVVRIPIDRAMQAIAAEGLPARHAPAPDFPAPAEEKRPLIETEGGDHVQKSY